jgi:hypothetical protein
MCLVEISDYGIARASAACTQYYHCQILALNMSEMPGNEEDGFELVSNQNMRF